MEELVTRAGAWQVIAQAKALVAEEKITSDVRNLNIEDSSRQSMLFLLFAWLQIGRTAVLHNFAIESY